MRPFAKNVSFSLALLSCLNARGMSLRGSEEEVHEAVAAGIPTGKCTFPTLWGISKTLAEKKHIDLTHSFAPGIPGWSGYPNEVKKNIYSYQKHGFIGEKYTIV